MMQLKSLLRVALGAGLVAVSCGAALAAVSTNDAAKAAVAQASAPAAATPATKGSTGRGAIDERSRTAMDDVLRVGGKRAGAKYQLRCWQFGRLVFEEARDTLLAESAKVITVSRSTEPGETVQMIDLLSSSCVLAVSP